VEFVGQVVKCLIHPKEFVLVVKKFSMQLNVTLTLETSGICLRNWLGLVLENVPKKQKKIG